MSQLPIKGTCIRVSNIVRKILLNHLSLSLYSRENRTYWKTTKNACKGMRGFVICNGPSLRMTDLDRLKDEITLASNKIYLAFEKTSWRPTFFTVCDQLVARKIWSQVHNHISIIHAPVDIGVTFRDCTTYYWKALPAPKKYPTSRTMFSDNALYGFHGGYSITYQNLQLAIHLGLDPIYLIGCDHRYKGEKDLRKVGSVKADETSNHFIKGYREKGELVNVAPIERMTVAFHHGRDFAEGHGIRIFNATRGGHLEVFHRVEFDKVMS